MNKIFAALSAVGVLAYCFPTMSANAAAPKAIQAFSNTIQPYTAGLIESYDISVSTSNKKLCLNGSTTANKQLKSIGFTNITIEYSSDNKNWHIEKDLDDLLKSGSSYYLNSYSVSVKGGYYYRVKLTHYAKESGLFGSSQSVDNTSNSVWIS